MHRPLLKVCGLRDADQASAVAALGVDAIGVIGVAASPRHVAPPARAELFAAVREVRPDCQRVLVVADPQEADLPLLDPRRGGHQVVQLHGSETPERCRELRQHLPDVIWWKALRIRTPEDLRQACLHGQEVDALLLDAWAPDQLGGTGRALPLAWLEGFSAPVPWWLAGGLTSERLPEVLAVLRPDGLDVSSGVEDAPGIKNLALVAELVAAISGRAGIPAA